VFPLQGSIEAGKDADFVVWDPEAAYTITEDSVEFKNKVNATATRLSPKYLIQRMLPIC
jgi:dihydroorotase-like cyclic amidohydrolase